ncbi:MAG: bifunctional aspartate kinase/homoserine dehydrogenase I, partial [Mariniphaga sp.]|nr:bifunctional aspartate kinase/homoserine dehydrogenase I [Mariniphaga sp.]
MGVGTVGGHLLSQLLQQQEKLLNEKHLKIKLTGVVDLNNMLFNREGIDLASYKEELKNSKLKPSLKGFVKEMKNLNLYNSIFVDCTASGAVADLYEQILDSNISVVAANKIASSSKY